MNMKTRGPLPGGPAAPRAEPEGRAAAVLHQRGGGERGRVQRLPDVSVLSSVAPPVFKCACCDLHTADCVIKRLLYIFIRQKGDEEQGKCFRRHTAEETQRAGRGESLTPLRGTTHTHTHTDTMSDPSWVMGCL